MAQTIKAGPVAAKRTAKTLQGTAKPAMDEERAKALSLYEAALRLMSEGRYEEARTAFHKMLEASPDDLRDRIRMYIAACVQRIDKGKAAFSSHEERFDYAISLLNAGKYDEAREHFQAILAENNSADFAFYGLALLASLQGNGQECLQQLTEAIKVNPQNRLQARADADFHNMADDPRFTELLYPES